MQKEKSPVKKKDFDGRRGVEGPFKNTNIPLVYIFGVMDYEKKHKHL